MKKLTQFLTLIFTLLNLLGYSQNLGIKWSTFAGNEREDRANEIHATLDGGYIAFGGGWTSAQSTTSLDAMIVKLDAAGNVLWKRLYGGNLPDEFYSGKPTSDGGYIAAGGASSSDGDVNGPTGGLNHAWLVKLDAGGEIVWSKLFTSHWQEHFQVVEPTLDGGFILGGVFYNGDFPAGSAWVVKVDAQGNEQWSTNYAGSVSHIAPALIINEIKSLAGGGYILAGHSAYEPGGDIGEHISDIDAWAARIDDQGNLVWEEVFGGTYYDYFSDVFQAPDGGFIFSGTSSSPDGDLPGNEGSFDLWVLKVNGNGVKQWSKNFGGIFGNAIDPVSGGGFIMAGQYDQRMWVLRFDDAANLLWDMKFSGISNLDDGLNDVHQTADGGFIVAGFTRKQTPSTDYADYQFAIFKLRNPDLPFDVDLSLQLTASNPNPAIYTNTSLTATLVNSGTDAATGVKVRFPKPDGVVYVGGNEWTASNGSFTTYGQEEWAIERLEAGETVTLTVNYFMLTSAQVTAYAQVWAMDQPDKDSTPGNGTPPVPNEDDEAAAGINAPIVQKPDLALANLDIPNPVVKQGQVLFYNFDVSNQGNAPAASAFTVKAWISVDNVISADDFQDFSAPFGTLGSGHTVYDYPGHSTVPAGLANGTYFLILKVDADNQIAESNEGNNVVSATFTVDSGISIFPELVGYQSEIIPKWNCYARQGELFGIMQIQVNNVGDTPASSFKVKFYLSTDDVFSANDLLWDTRIVPFLDLISINGPAFVNPAAIIPAWLASGKYYVFVTIDEENEVAEQNETNNNLPPFSIQIGAADLVLQGDSGVPSAVSAGSSFNVQATVKYENNGFIYAPSSQITLNAELYNGNYYENIGTTTFTLADFGPSNVVTKTVQATVPASFPLGTYNFRTIVYGSFCEQVNQGNYHVQPITVTGTSGQIDLELSLVQNSPNPVIYSHYTTTVTLKNKGPQTATGIRVKWAKPDGVVYTGGNEYTASQGSFIPFGPEEWTVGSIPANGTATLTVSYFLLQNGAPVTYAQVIAANETDVDSQPNNGTPPTPNEDDEASTGGTTPPVLTPDLTISNLVITNSPVQPGQVLTYNFDLANIGNGNASADFNVKAWISNIASFNTYGFQDGIVPTGNFIAGFIVTGVLGTSTIPSTLPNGQYYLHLWVDADQTISESNESNNYASASFVVLGTLQPGACDEMIGPGAINCLSHNSAGQLEVTYQSGNNLYRAYIDGSGQLISSQNIGLVPPKVDYYIEGNLLKKKTDGMLDYVRPIPAAILNQYDEILDFTEFNNGFVIVALKYSKSKLYGIRTNDNLVIEQMATLPGNFSGTATNYVNDLMQVTTSELAFTLRGIFFSSYFFVLNQNMETTQYTGLSMGSASGSASLSRTACNEFVLTYTIDHLPLFGRNYETTKLSGHFENGYFVVDHSYWEKEQSSMGVGTFYQRWSLHRPDGSVLIKGSRNQGLPTYAYPPSNNIHLEKLDNSNNVEWEKDVAPAGAVRKLAFSGDELVFLSEKVNAVFVESLTCLENASTAGDCDAITITPGPGQITIAGFSAPHVLIKVFRPNWTVAFECLDNCTNPLIVSGLGAGNHYIQVKLIDNGWGEICYLEQTVYLGGGNPLVVPEMKGRPVQLEAVNPNPVYFGYLEVKISSNMEGTFDLEIYDLFGRLAFLKKIELQKGRNDVPLDVSNLESGTYYLNMRGENWRGMPIRFVVARW